MKLNHQKLWSWPFRDIEHTFTTDETILYALSLGVGSDPTDVDQINFVYEKNLRVMPTLPLVLGMTDVGFMTDPEIGIDMGRLLHGESALAIHSDLPTQGTVVSRMKITGVVDKGADKGAVVHFSRQVLNKTDMNLLATESGSFFLKGNGGFGGPSKADVPEIGRRSPDRAPDLTCDVPTLPQSALIYRLNSDRNPLHVDPEVARRAGFQRPILHGACAVGIAGRVILEQLCGHNPRRFLSIGARMSAAIFPGDTLRFDIWKGEDGSASFRCGVVERNALVLTNGVTFFQDEPVPSQSGVM